MSQTEKAYYFNALKAAGIKFDRHYREYSTEELKLGFEQLREGQGEDAPVPDAGTVAEEPSEFEQLPDVPVGERDPNELPGQRLNTTEGDELQPIRTDEQGRVWYQEEVLKAGFAKPRGRRVLQYTSTGTEQRTVQNGDYVETFEVAGKGAPQAGEIKITLPSYQTGIYKDPRFPFKIHTYNGNQGFDFFEVAKYYGGIDLVPAEIKRVYVENVLCYDIRTTIRTIQLEYRQLQLAGKVD